MAGDESLARYGYCLGTALRSVWEVPQYFSLAAQLKTDPTNLKLQDRVSQLEQIINIQRNMATECIKMNIWAQFS